MRISELIWRLEMAKQLEGDIEVELPDGTLLRQVNVITKYKGPPTSNPERKNPPEAIQPFAIEE